MSAAHRLALFALCAALTGCAAEAVFIGDADAGRGTGRTDSGGGDTGESDVRGGEDARDDATTDAATDTTPDVAADTAPDTTDTGDDTADADICFVDCEAIDARACDESGRVITCADPDGDGCYAWSDPRACADDTVCRGGACVEDSTCDDECDVRGTFECVTDEARAECGDFDADPCLELGGPVACDVGDVCTEGVCAADCLDVCAPGETRCDEDGAVVTCGDYDADPCREFGAPTACTGDGVCTDGVCVDLPPDCLRISEYVEGASFDKAIEIVNCGGSARDMRTVGVCLFSNDDTSACSSSSLLFGSLAAGDTLVLCNPRSSIVACDASSGPVNFNGDDRLLIYQERGGGEGYQAGTDEVLDAFGQTTVRPPDTVWAEVTYRRCNPAAYDGRSVFVPTDWFTAHGAGDVSDLGNPPSLTGCP